MRNIVIMSSGKGPDEMFVWLVKTLFPECEISVIFPEQNTSADGERDQEVMKDFRKCSIPPRQQVTIGPLRRHGPDG